MLLATTTLLLLQFDAISVVYVPDIDVSDIDIYDIDIYDTDVSDIAMSDITAWRMALLNLGIV